MTVTIPTKFHGRARRDAAAFYLSQLARAILSGEISVLSGQEQRVVATPEFLTLDIEVTQRKRANRVEIKVRWPAPPLIGVATGGGQRQA